ncbi:LOW QUALITY PROTEIN: LEAF RUST 10 DISEASE-RESISTANCE LOCUS RECEPTOR-LIKE PROTEIN KINASE-like 1.1 [Phalaenopsis equestris]|uniref:LOW QUALITY PROTEIN: LEAF RUST 10 DISEASE-RESISTANCE LOCUS RECEPTOR-LIKE PROTEIN KINASE-like 1.1 n=1 Tax=Phalaenopsis equestris TaxID=78828 RepID=UPI0009E48F0C|nr:LOW QUALITY PROTEIN: LEAF RUST 10 DISEASE-RESISTANCE LOCUS RECEPTOR-LIKE PROTEIN KINASE-like 1.1 [Phalaenopsis equestris]
MAGGFSFIMFCFLCFLIYRRWKKKQSSRSNFSDRSTSFALSSKTDPELASSFYTPIFTYDELYKATNAFNASEEVGDGGFGTVYKGKLKDGRVVAVKRLYETNYRRAEQFMNEVKIVSLLRHQNLISLYGCTTLHSRELLLVYEFIPNGTVADHLHGSRASGSFLPWKVRMRIAIETADALNYLHSIEPQIIHRDIKTNNILLDNNFHVKVGDFGLSRLFPLDATHVSTAPQGTPGYVDPEYHKFFQLTDKSDVYSFGVVLMELISSMPAVDINRELHEASLAYMAIKKIQRQELHEFVDPRLGYHSDSDINGMITQVAGLALRCLQTEREMRPGIKEVLEILREIEKAACEAEGCLDVDGAVEKEEACLLKNIPPYSPNSVAERWVSTSSSMSSFSG